MAFYDDMVDVAFDLITEFGTAITVRREKTDTSKTNPWEGQTDENPVVTFVTVGAFLEDEPSEDNKTLLKRDCQRVLIPAKSADFVFELTDLIIRGSDTFEILEMKITNPASTIIMYDMKVAK